MGRLQDCKNAKMWCLNGILAFLVLECQKAGTFFTFELIFCIMKFSSKSMTRPATLRFRILNPIHISTCPRFFLSKGFPVGTVLQFQPRGLQFCPRKHPQAIRRHLCGPWGIFLFSVQVDNLNRYLCQEVECLIFRRLSRIPFFRGQDKKG